MKITFKNIAGYAAEIKEAKAICQMINEYEKYKERGITLPKGLLLYGEPGVGKTLFAQAIANEVKRKFIEVSVTEDTEEDMQMILQRKFKEAQENSPAILFIDELDKIVPSDAEHNPFYSDYSRKTLQLLLSQLDGFAKNPEVMVICTTNSLNDMPQALTRAGRIDKHIRLPLPNDTSRAAIANYYLNKVLYEKDVDINQFVLSSDGLSGADIKTVINEAAIKALSQDAAKITTSLLIEHINLIEGKSLITATNEKDADIVAYHELGHFVVANELKKIIRDINIHKTNHSLGRVRYKLDSEIMTTEDLLDNATIALGGRAAEIIFHNKKYVGSWHDIQKAYLSIEQAISYGDFGFEYLLINHSNFKTRDIVRDKTIEILNECLNKAISIVTEKKEVISELHPKLLKNKILTAADLKVYFAGKVIVATDEKEKDYIYDRLRDQYIEI